MNETEKKALRLELRKETLARLDAVRANKPVEISGVICSRKHAGLEEQLKDLGVDTTCAAYEAALLLVTIAD